MIENITFKARIENKFITKMFIITLFWFIIEMLCFFELTLRDNNTLYLNNYIRCVKSFNLGNLTVYINNAIGWYPTFNNNTSLMAMITALLSIHYIFRHISLDSYWFGVSLKERFFRVLISYILIAIGAVVMELDPNTYDKLGIRTLIMNGIVTLFVYGLCLAVIPKILFLRFHKYQKMKYMKLNETMTANERKTSKRQTINTKQGGVKNNNLLTVNSGLNNNNLLTIEKSVKS